MVRREAAGSHIGSFRGRCRTGVLISVLSLQSSTSSLQHQHHRASTHCYRYSTLQQHDSEAISRGVLGLRPQAQKTTARDRCSTRQPRSCQRLGQPHISTQCSTLSTFEASRRATKQDLRNGAMQPQHPRPPGVHVTDNCSVDSYCVWQDSRPWQDSKSWQGLHDQEV